MIRFSKFYGRLNVINVEIPKELFLKTPFKNKFSEFDGMLDFETDFHEFNGMITLENELGLEMKGEFSLLNGVFRNNSFEYFSL